jgi:hypothetical protein
MQVMFKIKFAAVLSWKLNTFLGLSYASLNFDQWGKQNSGSAWFGGKRKFRNRVTNGNFSGTNQSCTEEKESFPG